MKKREDRFCDKLKSEVITTTITRFGQEYTLENIPTDICQDCGAKYFDLNFLRKFENSILEQRKELIAA